MELLRKLFLGTGYRGDLQLDELDGIRGLAVLYVLFSHLANEGLVLFSVNIAGNASGKIGVYLFFTLSSFLLSRALLSESGRLTAADWLTYSMRRLTRIYPFYIVSLAFVVIASSCGWALFHPMSMSDFFSHLFLLDGKGHFWTIATEVKFYLILPLFIYAYRFVARRDYRIFIGGLLFVSLIAQIVSFMGLIEIRHSVLRYLPVFSMGTVIATLVHESSVQLRARVAGIARYLSYLLMLMMVALMPNVLGGVTEALLDYRVEKLVPSSFFWGILCSAFVLSCVLSRDSLLRLFFRSTWMRVIGAMSFSLYINHWFVLMWVRDMQLSVCVKLLVFWVCSILVSSLTFLVIERPLSRLKLEKVSEGLIRRFRC